jgi:hypothetical protein
VPAAAVVAAPAAAPETVPVSEAAAPAPVAAIAAPRPAEESSTYSSALLPIAGAVGLGLLALLFVGIAMRRRRRRSEEELAATESYEPAYEAEPQPAAEVATVLADPVAAELPPEPAVATAFVAAPAAAASDCADAAPGSHVEAACEGPTPDNPSLSIKKRLKRARFFDEREFLAEAGEVTPMASDAGLPNSAEPPAKAD